MSDRLTPSQRHTNMAAIRGKDTKPEIIVRKYLWAQGFRYTLNHPRLPGKPDIVLRKYRTCIFVNGCFWHGHNIPLIMIGEGEYKAGTENADRSEKVVVEGEDDDATYSLHNSECCKIPHTNREFWVKKIMRNKVRDKSVQQKLAQMGWHCITIWECELKNSCRQATLESLVYTLNNIFLADHKVKDYELEEFEPSLAAEDDYQ